jgi:ADP-ribose pyrophosphatase YjhB (NUDIX family)
VLLGRRASGKYAGLWCIPCGYVEWGEDVRAAAARESLEETALLVTVGAILAVHSNFHNPELHTVGIWFAGEVAGGRPVPADGELSELAYFDPAAPPPLAFPTDALVLEQLALQRMKPARDGGQ